MVDMIDDIADLSHLVLRRLRSEAQVIAKRGHDKTQQCKSGAQLF